MKKCFFILSISFGILGKAQDAQPDKYQDSLQAVIDMTSSVKVKTEALFLLGEHLVQRDPKLAEKIAQELKYKLLDAKDSLNWRRVSYIYAASNRWQGDYATALNYYNQIYQYSKEKKDSLEIAKSGHFIGSISTFIGQNLNAQFHLQETAKLYESIGTPLQKASINNSLAGFYLQIHQPKKAEDWYLKALEQFTILQDSAGLSSVNANLGSLYTDLGEFKKAEQHLLEQKKLNAVFPTLREMGFHYDFMGKLRQKEGKLEEAYSQIFKGLKIRENLSSTYNLCESKLNIAEILILLKRYPEAIQHLNDVFQYEEHQSLNQQEKAYELLSLAYEKSGNPVKALENYKAYKSMSDSINSEESMKLIVEKDALFQSQIQQAKIDLLTKEKELSNAQLSRSKWNTRLLLLGLLVFLVAVIVFYYLYNTNKSKNQFISKTLKEKELLLNEIHHRVKNNLQMISSLLNLQSKYVTDQKAYEALQKGRDRVQSMAILHKNLYSERELGLVDMQKYFEDLTENVVKSYNPSEKKIELDIQTNSITMDLETVIPIGLIVNELVTNSLKHAFPDDEIQNPKIEIRLNKKTKEIELDVNDNGIGFSGSMHDDHESFGQRLIRSLVQKLKADFQIKNENGTKVKLRIPNLTQ